MADAELESRTRYDPAETEPRIFARWEESGLFSPEPEGTAEENYSIAIPPPNVTGALHMGHALNGSIQDALIRLARMRGKHTRWILGTDHAGIGMQTQVEKLLHSEGTSREEIGREPFVERVWRFREEYGGQILQQYKRLGASADYEHERFTLDEGYVRAVLEVFVALYDRGLIYRDNYLVNWDPGTRSAISDLEVEERRVTDTLYYVDYPLASGHGSVTIATVRPETMLADTAIAVHPEDDRYTRLIGETALLPLVGRRLPIIADSYVKPEFGTGALKITPAHDPNDFEIGRAHGLEEITVIGEDGRMTEAAGDFAGMPVAEAHTAVVERLRAEGRIVRAQQYEHEVPFSQRSGERIEPLISLQWFMAMDELARPAIDAVRDGRVRIHPEGQENRYFEWMEKIRPWCISRQLWWGHQIPVWYRGEERYVGIEPPTGDGWTQDPDVLDTWFSSGLWPFATLGWPDDTPDLRAFYPTDVLLTARDILFLWVARMVMLGLEFAGDVPFEHVYVHSIIQAPDRRRMSKSLGTGIDPLDLIAGGPRPPVFTEGGEFPAYGADAVRFGLLAMSSTQDVRFNEEKIAQGRQLANKLWNAARLVLLRVPEGVMVPDSPPAPRAVEDRWILSRLQAAKADMARAHRRVRVPPRRARPVRLRLQRARRLVPRADQAAPVRRGKSGFGLRSSQARISARRYTGRPARARRDARDRAPDHPVRDRGDLVADATRPPADDLLMAHRWPEPDPALRDEAAEADVRRAIAATQELRGWRDRVGAPAGRIVPARLDAAGYESTADARGAAGPRRVVGERRRARRQRRRPGGTVAMLASEVVDHEAAARRAAARRAELEEGDRARRGKARQPGLRGQGARRGGRRRAGQAGAPA